MKINLNLNNIDNEMNLKMIQTDLEHVVINPDKRVFAFIKGEDNRRIGIEINSFEATMLVFAHKKLFLNSHINTIYQLFIKSLALSNLEIENISFESKVGDMIYATMKMIDKDHNRTFSLVSVPDALILSRMLNKKIYCTADLWEQFEETDDWDYEDYIIDLDEDDD